MGFRPLSIRRNIWLLYKLLCATAVIALSGLTYAHWQYLTAQTEASQRSLVKQWFGSFSSLLEQQETIITLIGQDILLRQREGNPDIRSELDRLMNINPEFFAGFALFSTAGEVLDTTSNLVRPDPPNLLQQPESKESFVYAIESDKMVLGRTYNAPRLVIPARKAIRDTDGQLLGIMTGALKIQADSGHFAHAAVLGPHNRITILRTRDRYIQYATNGELIPDFFVQPLPETQYRQLMQALQQGQREPEHPSERQATITFRWDTNSDREHVRGVALYNPRYEFWLLSEVEEGYLINQFLKTATLYIALAAAFLISMFYLFRFIDREQQHRRQQLQYQADHDTLTGLPNRNFLLEAFDQWQTGKQNFSQLFIDLDHFKGINDHFGHSIGDQILVELARRFEQALREDTLLVRHGGDEFVLLIATHADSTAAEERVGRQINAICANIPFSNMTFSPGCSIGVARYPEHGTTLDELLRAADVAMYEAKKERNTLRFFRTDLEEQYLYRVRIEQHLRGAETRGEIFLVYQPQADQHGRMYGVEALVRWQSPVLGSVPPDAFIPIAEHSGLITTLGYHIIDRALADIAGLQQQTGQTFSLSINVSARQLMENGFIDQLLERIDSSLLGFEQICIEVTENLLIEDIEQIHHILTRAKDAGVRMSLDDFGTGYSSLSTLRSLPFHEVKIDKSFVDHVTDDKTALAMVQNIIAIGQNYGMTVLAEGVETEEQLQCLITCGCDHFQGYLFARPLALDDLRACIARESLSPTQ